MSSTYEDNIEIDIRRGGNERTKMSNQINVEDLMGGRKWGRRAENAYLY